LKNDNHSNKKVLIIFSYILSPDRDAGSLRMYNLLQLFKALSWHVTFAVSDLQSSPAQHSFLEAIEVDVLEKPAVDSIEAHLQEHGQAYDLVIMSALSVALKYLSCIRNQAPAAKLVFDTTDLQHVREYRRARVTGEGGWLQIAMRSKKWELAAVNAADCTWVVSPTETAVLEKACPGAKVHILSVIQTVYGSARPFSEREGILFIGSFPHHPNADAMQYFVDQIYPLLKAQLNGEKIFIIGPEPPDWLQQQATDKLHITGYVPDVRPYFDRCKLSIAPLRYGAGVNGKVMLSMSYGVPVVASSVAAEGIPLVKGDDILVADDPATFAQAIANLYHNEPLWNQLSKNGLEVINQHYSFETSRTHLVNILEDLGYGRKHPSR
jgi:glycosyltransferase involved in cell wall biosynthesis